MRYTTLAFLAVLATGAAHAEPAKCEQVAEAAKLIMDARQNGAALQDMLDVAGDNELLIEMSVEAYENPRYSTAEYKRRAVGDYRDQWHVMCLRAK